MYSTLPTRASTIISRFPGFASYAKARTCSTEGGRPVRSRNRRLKNSWSSESVAGWIPSRSILPKMYSSIKFFLGIGWRSAEAA